MEETQFAVFKYDHASKGCLSPKRLKFIKLSAALALVAAVLFFPFGLIALVLPFGAWLSAPKQLSLGPRYLICGNEIVYYGNVDKLMLDSGSGQLRLFMAGNRSFTIEQAKFPTNARKAHKVAANKAAKFRKVSEKIIDKVRRASPAAELIGVAGN